MSEIIQTEDDNENNNSFKDEFCEWINTILGAFFVILILFTFVAKQVRVDGPSMMQTLQDKDRLVISSFYSDAKVGDIIVMRNEALDKRIVKRVIATENQEINIDFEKGIVYVDGKQIYEPYINNLTTDNWSNMQYPMTVPKGCYFVMGDNRGNSCDSRDSKVGFVKKEDVAGKAVLRLYPFNKITKL